MPLRLLAIALVLTVPFAAGAQTPANPDPTQPDFSMIVEGTFDPETLAEFNRRVQDYAALRSRLEVGLPPLVVTTNPDEIETFERKLAERIRHSRGSRRGQLFAACDGRAVEAHDGALAPMRSLSAAIMDDNPGEFDVDVNDTYKKKYALATMPPKLLLLLPDLAAGPPVSIRWTSSHSL